MYIFRKISLENGHWPKLVGKTCFLPSTTPFHHVQIYIYIYKNKYIYKYKYI